jgi:DNA repair protein RadC
LELADDGPAWSRDASASSSGDRKALARLIRPICGSAAFATAGKLVAEFGSLPAVLRANRPTLARLLCDFPAACELIMAARAAMLKSLQIELRQGPILSSSRAVLDYLFAHLAHEPAEQVRVLYLDAKNRLLRDDIAIRGTVDRADIFPREIIRRALDLGASGLVLAHNHPSGDPSPSPADMRITQAVIEAAKFFDIVLHDHIIVGRAGHISLRATGGLFEKSV